MKGLVSGMGIYVTRLNGPMNETVRQAQQMVSDIALNLGFKEMGIYYYNAKDEEWGSMSPRFDGIIAGISWGDIVIIQYPVWNGYKFLSGLIGRIKAYGGRIVIFIHDVEALMFENAHWMLQETIDIFNQAELLIVPSVEMKKFLLENGIKGNVKFVIQEIFDYITGIDFDRNPQFVKEMHFAGNPDKLPTSNEWNYDILLKIYSTQMCAGRNVKQMDWMNPSALLLEIAKGGFGLVWYGNEYWHQYMKHNNSLKLSVYLAAGVPVVAPIDISNRDMIEKNHLGLLVNSVDEAVDKILGMTEKEYNCYVEHIKKFAILIRNGYFTKKFLIEAIHKMSREDI